MRKMNEANKSKGTANGFINKNQHKKSNGPTAAPINNVSFYIANALIYMASEQRVQGNMKTLERSLGYLNKIHSHLWEPKCQVWDKAHVYEVGYEFKALSSAVQFHHSSEDIEKAIICLMAMSDLIMHKSDIKQVVHNLRSRQVMHELKHGLEASLQCENE